MKILRKVVVVVVVLLLVGLLVLMLSLDHLVKRRVESGATYAMGVPTTLGSVNLSLLGGGVRLDKLNVANPAGYKSPHFFAMDRSHVQVALRSLPGQTVQVPLIELGGIDVHLEKLEGKANYSVILENMGRFERGEKAPPPAEREGKRLIINRLLIEDINVTVDLLPVGGNLTRQQVHIPRIELHDIGSDTDRGVLVSQVSGIVVKAVFKSLIDSGIQLPGNILNELSGGLANLGSLGDFSMQVVGDVGSQVLDVGAQVGQQIGEIGERAGEAIGEVGRGVTEGIGGLLRPRQADPDPQE
jgi:hypothetical protein